MPYMGEQCCSQKIKDYKIKIPVSVIGQLTTVIVLIREVSKAPQAAQVIAIVCGCLP